MDFIEELRGKLTAGEINVVYPEGEDPRILWAAEKLHREGIIHPVVLGNLEEIKKTAQENNLDIEGMEIIDVEHYEFMDEMVAAFVERRKGKIDEAGAREKLKDANYLGTMMVYTGKAEGMVSGAVHTTGDTVLPALQIIKTKEGVSRISGSFLMLRGDEKYLFADCAINMEMDTPTLAEVAVASYDTAKAFGIDPKVAMLSFSTKGSASSPVVDKVADATRLVKETHPEIPVDGELQFDAAFVAEVGSKKAPGSDVAGKATVFVFPSLEAGNIGYKIAQRLGGFTAVGPILQGLALPVNDLSRGCSKEEAYQLAYITAIQAKTLNK
ncbi:MAG: phosphate acetyltransferase [Tissierellia bacterium]|nr:phosphate acetyltransferase [Tissierellia bacterium]